MGRLFSKGEGRLLDVPAVFVQGGEEVAGFFGFLGFPFGKRFVLVALPAVWFIFGLVAIFYLLAGLASGGIATSEKAKSGYG